MIHVFIVNKAISNFCIKIHFIHKFLFIIYFLLLKMIN